MPKGHYIRPNIIERIERYAVDMRDDECWLSTLAPYPDGYVPIKRNGCGEMLHRIAYEAHYAEPIPEGMVVMHTCDNPSCFNPAHLVLGTQSDNICDCVAKGRFSCDNAPKGAGSRSR